MSDKGVAQKMDLGLIVFIVLAIACVHLLSGLNGVEYTSIDTIKEIAIVIGSIVVGVFCGGFILKLLQIITEKLLTNNFGVFVGILCGVFLLYPLILTLIDGFLTKTPAAK
ncbi:MAG: hypothetical protein ACTSXQ_07860 [Alphaproteobacteria bacterium]